MEKRSKKKSAPKKKPSRVFTLQWVFEPFAEEEQFFTKSMFGGLSAYLDGRMVLVLAEDEEATPWHGVLCPTDRQWHESLMTDFPELQPHSILPKWLYLSMKHPEFESVAMKIAQAIAERDPRFGIEPKVKRARKKAARKRKV